MKLSQLVKLDEMQDAEYNALDGALKTFLTKALGMNIVVRDHVQAHNKVGGVTGKKRRGTTHDEYRGKYLRAQDVFIAMKKFAVKYGGKIRGWTSSNRDMEGVIWDEAKQIQVIIGVNYSKERQPYTFTIISIKNGLDQKKPRPGDKRFNV